MVQHSTNMKFTEKDIGRKVRPTQDTVKKESFTFKSVDEIYTISKVDDQFCAVVSQTGEEHSGWFHYRFEFVDKPKFKPGDKVLHSGGCQPDCKGQYYTLTTRHSSNGGCSHEGHTLEYYWSTEEYSTGVWENFLTLVEEPFVACDWDLRGPLGGISAAYSTPTSNHFYNYYKDFVFSCGDGVPMWNASHEDIIKSNYIKYNDMNIIDKIRVNIKGGPMKTLIKNDILTLDERLTTTGKELFADFLYAKHKDEFIEDLAPKLEGLNEDK